MESETEVIYEFFADLGRMGDLEGYFIATEKDVQELIDSGEELQFGEVLGKHSDISFVVTADMITAKSGDKDAIALIRDIFQCGDSIMGINPMEYLYEQG